MCVRVCLQFSIRKIITYLQSFQTAPRRFNFVLFFCILFREGKQTLVSDTASGNAICKKVRVHKDAHKDPFFAGKSVKLLLTSSTSTTTGLNGEEDEKDEKEGFKKEILKR